MLSKAQKIVIAHILRERPVLANPRVCFLKSVSFKKTVEISSTQEICTEFTHIIYCKWVNSVQISWVLEISTVFLKETDFS